MIPKAKYIGLIAAFTALISVSSVFAHMIAWVGHPTIGAIVVTFLYLTAFSITNKLGTTTLIGILVGIVNSLVFSSPFSIPVHFTRGTTFDIFFLVSGHRLCCRRCAIASGMLSFYITMTVVFALYTLFGLNFVSWIIWFIIVGVPSVLLTIPGSLLALKYSSVFRKVIGW